MVLDRDSIVKNSDDFFALYNITSGRIREMCDLKLAHTHAVAENSDYIAGRMGLSSYDRDLAWTVGVLHDFARFGQAVVTRTFSDSDLFNHARLGARLLFNYGMVEDIIPNYGEMDMEDRRVLENAIYHHSDFHLPDGLSNRERMFCEIIREADQIDIFRTIETSTWEAIYGVSKEELLATDFSDEIAAAFYRHELADYSKRKTLADYRLAHIALVFGLKSEAARQRASEQGYLRQMMDIVFSDPKVHEKYLPLKKCVLEVLP